MHLKRIKKNHSVDANKTKILHIFAELKPSGGEAMVLSAASLWQKEAEIHLLSTGSSVGEYAEVLEKAGYRIHHIAFAKRLSFFISVGRLLREGRFDIVHLHTERASPIFAATTRLYLGYSIVLLRTVHHIFKFKGFLRWRKLIERQVMRRILRVTLISNSPSGQKNEWNRYRVKNPLIPNWYDSDKYVVPTESQRQEAREILDLPDDLCVFISLGGNWSYKNYGMIVEALGKIDDSLRILYIQVGPQGEGAPLEAISRVLGVQDRIRCAGVVENPLSYLHAADVYLMPSSEEGFGVAAVEAMATGVPAVLSNVEALSDFRDRVAGILYVEPNPTAIASAMVTMCGLSNDQRRSLGRRQAEAVRENYGLSNGPKKYAELYRTGEFSSM